MNRADGRFILLGSASKDLLLMSNETLAGRIVYIELTLFFITRSIILLIFERSFIIILLQPWHVNIGKRLVKSLKVYFIPL